MKPVILTIKIDNYSQSIELNTSTLNLESQLTNFISKVLQSQVTLEKTEGPKEILLNEAPKENFNAPRPAPLNIPKSYGMGDPFKGTSWGINK